MYGFSLVKNRQVIGLNFFFFKRRACYFAIANLFSNFFHYQFNALGTFAPKFKILAQREVCCCFFNKSVDGSSVIVEVLRDTIQLVLFNQQTCSLVMTLELKKLK